MEGYFDEATSFDSLYHGLKRACRNVRWKDSVVGYEANGLANTYRLAESVARGSYRISPYQEFVIREPKERRILASRMPDRQLQRALCDAGLYEDIAEHLVRDNYACQEGRGTDDAIERLRFQLMRHWRRHGSDGWYLKCDVRHFFASIRHDVAKAAVAKRVGDPRAAQAVFDVIDSFGGEVGLGLGSQISQLVALAVLDDMDHLIKERLGIRCYARYMDDFILVHEDREHLRVCREAIAAHLESIGLSLNAKTTLQPLRHGVYFLQWRFVLTRTGRVLLLLSPKRVATWRRKLLKVWEREVRGESEPGSTREVMRSYLAHAMRGNTCRIRMRLIAYYKEVTGDDYFDREISRGQAPGGAHRGARSAPR